MIKSYCCVNISSKDPERLVRFYNETLGVPILEFDENYDGVALGFIKDAPNIMVWDENKWGKSSDGKINFVFNCDDLDVTYKELKEKGVQLEPPIRAVWGGMELPLQDPDGNPILLL
jgi:predicted enzyme related to lactoylglutathione lyase